VKRGDNSGSELRHEPPQLWVGFRALLLVARANEAAVAKSVNDSICARNRLELIVSALGYRFALVRAHNTEESFSSWWRRAPLTSSWLTTRVARRERETSRARNKDALYDRDRCVQCSLTASPNKDNTLTVCVARCDEKRVRSAGGTRVPTRRRNAVLTKVGIKRCGKSACCVE
jgi:hypothetical protein